MTTTNEEKEAAATLLELRQPRACYNRETECLDISYCASVEQHSNWPELDDFVQSEPARLGDTDFGLSVRTQTPYSDGFHHASLRVQHQSKGGELHRIVATWKAIHDVEAWSHSARIKISLDDKRIISWILRRCCYTIQRGDPAVDVRRRVRFLFKVFEVVFQGCDMTTIVLSASAIRDAKRLLAWVDESCLDHATVLTNAGFTYLTGIHDGSYSPSNTFYGWPGNPKRGHIVTRTEFETDGSTEQGTSSGSNSHY